MSNAEFLHERYNSKSNQAMPKRIKGYTRADLACLFAELGFRIGAEIGVADGKHALMLCENIPSLKLYCVDPYTKYHWKHSQESHEACYEQAQEVLKPYNATFMRYPSLVATQFITDASLDFVYIDGDHSFDHVMQDIIEWSKKVRRGGIVAGHDYYRFDYAGVVDAVNVYTHAHQINEWFIDDQRETGFFWVKP